MTTDAAPSTSLHIADAMRLIRDDPRLNATWRAYDATGRVVTVHAQRVAAGMVRDLLPAAHRLVFDKRDDDNGECRITLAYARDDTGALLWHGDDFDEHPDAVDLANVEAYGGPPRVQIDWQTVDAIEEALRDAYEVSSGFFWMSDEDAPGRPEANLLELVIPDALAGDAEPIVTIDDEAALRARLTDPATVAEHGLDAQWRPTAANVVALVQDLVDNGADAATGEWAVHPVAERLFVSHLADGTVSFAADLADGGRVTTLPQDDADLRDSRDRCGVDAAVEALMYVAALLNGSKGSPDRNARASKWTSRRRGRSVRVHVASRPGPPSHRPLATGRAHSRPEGHTVHSADTIGQPTSVHNRHHSHPTTYPSCAFSM